MRLLADMEVFVEVARLRNFGRAAAALGVTASTLSRRVAGLERELGVVLIRRSTRSLALTESGQEFSSVPGKSWKTLSGQKKRSVQTSRRYPAIFG